ncbi:hypothetical protein F4780DRAFT_383821 [Xylariomycetidae sp. FL0641]|nr:hypothetical protein F4780DRAFT_383821 [Xylariomycetidae sp. FL0641]
MGNGKGSVTTMASQPEAREPSRSRVYDTIMTPINFISFLLSLYLVDAQYQTQRSQGHYPASSPSYASAAEHSLAAKLPPWLHHLLFRPQQPYAWISRGSPTGGDHDQARVTTTTTTTTTDQTPWFYHTKQRKLLKREAADAFELRATVLAALTAAALAASWLAFCLLVGGWRWARTAGWC